MHWVLPFQSTLLGNVGAQRNVKCAPVLKGHEGYVHT